MQFVRHDSADFCPGENDVFRFFSLKKFLHRRLVAEVEFRMGALENVGVSLFFKFADAGAADHSAVTADEDLCVSVNHFSSPY